MWTLNTHPKHSVHVTQTDERYDCHTNESLLKGMLRLGRKGIPVGCVNGGCGVCKVRIVSGSVSTISSGRSTALANPSSSAETISDEVLEKRMPLNTWLATHKDSAVMPHCMKKPVKLASMAFT